MRPAHFITGIFSIFLDFSFPRHFVGGGSHVVFLSNFELRNDGRVTSAAYKVAGENPSNWSRYNFFSHLKKKPNPNTSFHFSQNKPSDESKRQKTKELKPKNKEETTFSQRLRGALTYLLIATGVVISPRG
jgi:hypothetical protein